MKPFIFIIISILLFSSCLTQSRIVLSGDGQNDEQTLRLRQHLAAQNDHQKTIPLLAEYFYVTEATIEMSIALRSQHKTDSLFYWILDSERFGFAAAPGNSDEKDEKTAKSSFQIRIPESLWISIANADSISFRTKLEQADYKIDLPEKFKKRLKFFFELAIDEAAKTRPLQEGKMKW